MILTIKDWIYEHRKFLLVFSILLIIYYLYCVTSWMYAIHTLIIIALCAIETALIHYLALAFSKGKIQTIPLFFRVCFPFFILLLYPGSKWILSLFGLNWRTHIDVVIFFSCIIVASIYVLCYICKNIHSTVLFVALLFINPITYLIISLNYSLFAITDAEIIVEDGQRYILAHEQLGLLDWYTHKYEIIGPCFRSAEAVEYDIYNIDAN